MHLSISFFQVDMNRVCYVLLGYAYGIGLEAVA